MNYRLVLSSYALDEIESNALWWADHHSPSVSRRWFDGVFAALELLRQDPLRHGLAREAEYFPYELKQHLYGVGRRPTHRILFTVRGDEVVVLSVRHTSRGDVDPGNLPDPEQPD